MRARNLKPGFFKNDKLADLGPHAMLLYQGLWCLADREGRLEDRPLKIRAEVFPYFPRIDVDKLLDKLQEANFIFRYGIANGRFIQIPSWHKHQNPHYKELPSDIPPPPGEKNKLNYTPVNKKQAERIFERDGHVCASCGSPYDLTIDHITSRANGGDSSDDNLRTLCRRCNSAKGSRDDRAIIDQSSTNYDPSSDDDGALTPDSLTPDSGLLTPDKHLASPSPSAPGDGECFDLKPDSEKPPEGDSTEFVEFWTIYPLKVRKAKARKALKAALKRTTWPKIKLALLRDMPKMLKDGEEYTPHPATWLNGNPWEDEGFMPVVEAFVLPEETHRCALCGDTGVRYEGETGADIHPVRCTCGAGLAVAS